MRLLDMIALAILACILVVFMGAMWHQTDILLDIGNCVHETAQVEGFHGTPKEDWELFADYCVTKLDNENK